MAEAQHWEALRKQRLLDRKREYNNVKEGLYRYWSTSKDVYNVRSFYFIKVAKLRYWCILQAERAGPRLGTINVYPEADSHHRAKLRTPQLDKRFTVSLPLYC